MKFQQRLAMLSSAAGCTLIYLLLLYTQGVLHVWHGTHTRLRRSLFADYDFDQKYWSPTLKPLNCEYATDQYASAINDSILTINLPATSNFNVYSNKKYKMAHPPVDQQKGKINVIILPHSHVDAGWLRTVEEYYVIHVKKILNNMVAKLNKYENMTFVWAETIFLSMWWNELDDHVKLQVQRLVKKGRLEIVLGGWVMTDEASSHYVSVIDQLSEGHQWVMEHLHIKPINSWSIDPFGHSGTMPYLWKQAGMENMVIQRVHQAIKATLAKEKNLEFKWRQYWDRDGSTDILCHIMPYIYYGVQYSCGPDRHICSMYDYGKPNLALNEKSSGRHVTQVNIAQQAKYLYDQFRLKGGLYKYDTILVPIGDDFRFDNSDEWDHNYQNYMRLMDYMNSQKHWNINVKFGTLADYFRQIRLQESKAKKDPEYKFPVLRGDFFPYSDQNSDYWTGYFTTRPYAKQLSRDVESGLRAADILNSMAFAYSKLWGSDYESYHDIASQLQTARRNLGLFLHHDAITGTSKPHVVEDYESKLLYAYHMVQNSILTTVQSLITRGRLESPSMLSPVVSRSSTNTLPHIYTIPTGHSLTKIIIFNSIAQERTEFINLIISDVNVEITNSEGNNIPFQINPVFQTSAHISSEYKVVFLVELYPLGIETYFLRRIEERHNRYWTSVITYGLNLSANPDNTKFMHTSYKPLDSNIYLENEFMRVFFNNKGMLDKTLDKGSGKITQIKTDLLVYRSAGSGAYVFSPEGEAMQLLHEQPEIRVIKGPFMEQIQVVYKYLIHTVTLYDTPSVQGQGIHIENQLDMTGDNMIDMEVIMRISSSVKNEMGHFFTDQNGYQLIRRQTDTNRNIETNYYPITSMAVIEDRSRRLTLHCGQSHGVASLQAGWLEVMLDRKLSADDSKGLGEGVLDNKLTSSKFVLQVEYKHSDIPVKIAEITFPSLASTIQSDLLQQPMQLLFTTVQSSVFEASFHPVNHSLPCDITIVSLKSCVDSDLVYTGTSLTLHRTSYSCDYPVTGLQCSLDDRQVSLRTLLPEININGARETSLTNMYIKGSQLSEKEIAIKPMQLKTYWFRTN